MDPISLITQLLTTFTPIVLDIYNKRKSELGRDPTEEEVIASLHAHVQEGRGKIAAWMASHPQS